MVQKIKCPCGVTLRVSGTAEGQVFKCPKCGEAVRTDAPSPASEAPSRSLTVAPTAQPAPDLLDLIYRSNAGPPSPTVEPPTPPSEHPAPARAPRVRRYASIAVGACLVLFVPVALFLLYGDSDSTTSEREARPVPQQPPSSPETAHVASNLPDSPTGLPPGFVDGDRDLPRSPDGQFPGMGFVAPAADAARSGNVEREREEQEPRAVEGLIRVVTDTDKSRVTRIEAIKELASHHEAAASAIPALGTLIRDPDYRDLIIDILPEFRRPEGVSLLIPHINHIDTYEKALESLAKFGPLARQAIPEIKKATRLAPNDLPIYGMQALINISAEEEEAVPFFAELFGYCEDIPSQRLTTNSFDYGFNEKTGYINTESNRYKIAVAALVAIRQYSDKAETVNSAAVRLVPRLVQILEIESVKRPNGNFDDQSKMLQNPFVDLPLPLWVHLAGNKHDFSFLLDAILTFQTIEFLGSLGSCAESALPALRKYLNGQDPKLMRAAERAIERIKTVKRIARDAPASPQAPSEQPQRKTRPPGLVPQTRSRRR